MIEILIWVVVVVLVAGVLAWLIQSAPFIDARFKQLGVWVILAVAVLIILLKLVGIAGVDLSV